MTKTIIIDSQFNGPPTSANGGYACGVVAACLNHDADASVEVTLHAPPPLDKALSVIVDAEPLQSESLQAFDDDVLVARAKPVAFELQVPQAPSLAMAELAEKSYSGFRQHPFPGCFVCGPHRAVKDGLRIFSGPLEDRSQVCSPWQPFPALADEQGNIRPEFVWSALDCPSYFGAFIQDDNPTALLGRMTLRLTEKQIPVNNTYIVSAWPIERDGRKAHGGSALLDLDGKVLAKAKATWIVLA